MPKTRPRPLRDRMTDPPTTLAPVAGEMRQALARHAALRLKLGRALLRAGTPQGRAALDRLYGDLKASADAIRRLRSPTTTTNPAAAPGPAPAHPPIVATRT